MDAITSGDSNSAVGYGALTDLTTASGCDAFGRDA